MQQKGTRKRVHNLQLDHIINDVNDVDNPTLCRNANPKGERMYRSKRRNMFGMMLSAISSQLRKITSPSRVLIATFLIFSIVLHLLLVEGVYRASQKKAEDMQKENPKKIALRIAPPAEPRVVRKATVPKPTPETRKEKAPTLDVSRKGLDLKQLSPEKLTALGQKHMGMLREGTFPALTLSYRSPLSYISEMYALGAKTVVYNTVGREYHEINLLNGNVLPLSSSDFKNFSAIKRVIEDAQWWSRKASAASRLNTMPESLEILLLLPMTVEARWVGHQVNVLSQMHIRISAVQTVEAQFQDAKFKLTRVHLKDGSSRRINDRGCA